VLTHSLKIVEGRDGDRRPLQIFWKKDRESLSLLSSSEFKLETSKTFQCHIPPVKLDCSFLNN